MKKPHIVAVQKDLSIPYFEQIQKSVISPYHPGHQIYYSIKPPDYVAILALTPENKLVIVKQYRPAVEDYTYELPSGHIDSGETPSQAIIRELKEETNCIANDVVLLGETIPDTGRLENRQWAFYSNDLVVNEFPEPEENEGIEVSLVTPDEFVKMIANGEFKHALDLCVIALAISQRYLKL
jgi:ADP-ribose pyrophosphatase